MVKNLNDLNPGESAVYYTGECLARNKCEAGDTAFEMYYNGLADLTQRKVKITKKVYNKLLKKDVKCISYIFDYIITRRREPITGTELILRKAHYRNLANGRVK